MRVRAALVTALLGHARVAPPRCLAAPPSTATASPLRLISSYDLAMDALLDEIDATSAGDSIDLGMYLLEGGESSERSGSVFRFLDSFSAGEGPASAPDDAPEEESRDLAAVAALVADRAAEGMDATPMTYEPMAVMAGPERVEEKERRRTWMQEAADMRKDIARASSRVSDRLLFSMAGVLN